MGDDTDQYLKNVMAELKKKSLSIILLVFLILKFIFGIKNYVIFFQSKNCTKPHDILEILVSS